MTGSRVRVKQRLRGYGPPLLILLRRGIPSPLPRLTRRTPLPNRSAPAGCPRRCCCAGWGPSLQDNIYKAFRQLGRVIRTITLLRYISEPELREEITAATNKVEAYNEFSAWLRFGHDTIERNDPAEQEKIIKF